MEEMRREEIMMQEDELRREANMAMQSYYSYGSQGVAESYRREESSLNSSRFAVDQIEEPLSWRLQPQLHSPRLRDEQVVLSTTRRYHQHEPPLPYHPPPPPPPPSLLVSNRFNLLDHSVHDTSGYLDTEGESEEGRTSTPRRHRGRGATLVRSKSSSPSRQANLMVRRQREMV